MVDMPGKTTLLTSVEEENNKHSAISMIVREALPIPSLPALKYERSKNTQTIPNPNRSAPVGSPQWSYHRPSDKRGVASLPEPSIGVM